MSKCIKNKCDLIDFEKGWSFGEEDKLFILKYFKQAIEAQKEFGELDEVMRYKRIYNDLLNNNVEDFKEVIQEEAFMLSECVHHDIYEYYDEETIKFIEKSLIINQC